MMLRISEKADRCQLLDDAIGGDAGALGARVHRLADGELDVGPAQQGVGA